MTLSLLIDADVIIDIQREYAPAVDWYSGLDRGNAGLPGFVGLELIQMARTKRDASAASQIVECLPVLWPSIEWCDWALANFASLYLANNVGALDVLIGATALTHGIPLATFNTKHFRAIPGVITVQPYRKASASAH